MSNLYGNLNVGATGLPQQWYTTSNSLIATGYNNNNDMFITGPGYGGKPSISDLLKDPVHKGIVLCKSREACKQKYGEFGLEIYDSTLNDILQSAIKSEESFNRELQTRRDIFNKLKQYVLDLGTAKTELDMALLEADILAIEQGK